MKGRYCLTILLALLIASIGGLPSLAGDKVNIEVNGDPATFFEVPVEKGTSMISAEAFARFAGADLERPAADTVRITEQDKTLELTVGKSKALLGNKPVTLPCAPVKSEEKVLIPLRFVSDTFGFNVGWDNQQKAISLTRSETRDGMTPSDVLAKSNQAIMDINTYSMKGSMDIKMNIAADGEEIKDAPKNMNIEMEGQIQSEPLQVYMKQKITPVLAGNVEEMVMETYMTTEKMYMKAPGQEWVVQDIPFSPEFWKEQMDIQSDPIKAAAQMKEMGILLNFGNDTSINGQDYYVVNATLDMEKFQEGYQKLIQQAIQSLPQDENDADPRQVQEVMKQFLDNTRFDYYYTTYINKDSLVTDIVKTNILMDMTVNIPETPDLNEQKDTPKQMKMSFDMQGEFKIDGLGEPFEAPDVSSARDIKELNEQQVEVPQPANK